jgi:hypothetical protein
MSRATVVELTVGDDPAPWRDAGFLLDGDACSLGDVRLRFHGHGTGLTSWAVAHPDVDPGATDVDGLPTELVGERPPDSVPAHPNGTTGLDHIVVSTPDIDRTTAALSGMGVEARRTRDTTAGDRPLRQRFFRMGTIIEVIGPPDGDPDGGPARFWGLAVVTEDIDRTAAVLGDRLGRVKDAVQPGRRIATLRTRELGISVPVAFMSPHVR